MKKPSRKPLPALKSAATITTDDPTDNSPRLCRVEQKLDVMIAALTASKPITPPTAHGNPSYFTETPLYHGAETISQKSIERLFQALRRRDKIPAIKEVRAMLGLGLKEAKDLCEKHFFEPETPRPPAD